MKGNTKGNLSNRGKESKSEKNRESYNKKKTVRLQGLYIGYLIVHVQTEKVEENIIGNEYSQWASKDENLPKRENSINCDVVRRGACRNRACDDGKECYRMVNKKMKRKAQGKSRKHLMKNHKKRRKILAIPYLDDIANLSNILKEQLDHLKKILT